MMDTIGIHQASYAIHYPYGFVEAQKLISKNFRF